MSPKEAARSSAEQPLTNSWRRFRRFLTMLLWATRENKKSGTYFINGCQEEKSNTADIWDKVSAAGGRRRQRALVGLPVAAAKAATKINVWWRLEEVKAIKYGNKHLWLISTQQNLANCKSFLSLSDDFHNV